jgi:hypothetical protein
MYHHSRVCPRTGAVTKRTGIVFLARNHPGDPSLGVLPQQFAVIRAAKPDLRERDKNADGQKKAMLPHRRKFALRGTVID